MKRVIEIFFLLIMGLNVFAQNVGIGTNTPKAALDVTSTTNGFLPPRMTFTDRNLIVNPSAGLIIWCTDCLPKGEVQVFNGSEWTNMIGGEAAVIFPVMQIGTQVWSSKNLDVVRYRNGDLIPQITNSTDWANLTTGAWCWYNNDSTNFAQFGKLYNWYAVNDPRGLAPQGWHIPSDAEWNILTKFIDPNADTSLCCSNLAGIPLKSTSGWMNNSNGTNSSGFDGIPNGYRNANGVFSSIYLSGGWWSSNESELSTNYATGRFLHYLNNDIRRNGFAKSSGDAIRLLKNN